MSNHFWEGGFQDTYPVQSDENLLKFADWSQEIVKIIENRLFGGQFEKVINYVSTFNVELVTRLLPEQMEEQLVFCSQYKFTIKQIGLELELYQDKILRYYKVWMANRYNEARKKLLEIQKQEVSDGIRTRGGYDNLTKDDLNSYVIENFTQQYNRWNDFISNLKRAKGLVDNLVDDIENRAIILMSLRKRKFTD